MKKTKAPKLTLEEITDSQKEFIKTVLGMYITNNIVVASYKSTEEIHSDADEYVKGMLAGDEFYYLVNYIVDEVTKEPEWEVFLEANLLNAKSLKTKEWEELFTEVLKTIDSKYLYSEREPNKDIIEFKEQFSVECQRQSEIRKKKEEKERKEAEKRRKEEEKKRKEKEAAEKASKKVEEADAEEIKE